MMGLFIDARAYFYCLDGIFNWNGVLISVSKNIVWFILYTYLGIIVLLVKKYLHLGLIFYSFSQCNNTKKENTALPYSERVKNISE
jgi:hypothetical protein